jgi:antirestriction protein ArdC
VVTAEPAPFCVLAGTTDARGFRQWQEAGRRVKKGSRAIRILAPRTRKIRETTEPGEDVAQVIVTGFLGIPVFRYEDTEGEAIEVPDYRPATFPPLVDGAERLGVSVAWAPFTERYRGYYQPTGDRIVLCSHDEAVFFHELAHAAHRRVLEQRGETMVGGQNPRQEIVAEVVAATLCRLYGLDGFLGHCRSYVDSYVRGDAFAGNERPARAAMRVLGDVQAVLNLILGAEQTREDQTELVAVAA